MGQLFVFALSSQSTNIHNVFHVSQLRKYILDSNNVVEVDDVQVK